jgi:hypothetical protein
MPIARVIQRSRNAWTFSGVPMNTYSRMRNDWNRSMSREGSRRKQSQATSKVSPSAGIGPAAAASG